MIPLIGFTKTLNLKYFKKATYETDKYISQHLPLTMKESTQSFSNPTPFHPSFQLYNFQNSLSHTKPQPHYQTSVLNSIKHQSNFSNIQDFYTTEKQQSTTYSAHSIKEFKLQVDNIQTLQFQSNSPIQDRIVTQKLKSINALCVNVFDGHGGNMLADYASKTVVEFIDLYLNEHKVEMDQSQEETINVIKSAIQHAYDQIEQKFYQLMESQLKTGNKDIIKIGSCGLTAIIYKDNIIVGNCGDSQGIVVTEDDNGLCYFSTNQQLNTSNVSEIDRIQQQFRHKDKEVFTKSKANGKIYIKGILQPTRTLGDYYLKREKYFRKVSSQPYNGPYISHKPQFRVISIQSSFRHLIIASDGLWDFATKKDILKVVESFQIVEYQELQSTQQLTEEDLCQTYNEKVAVQNKVRNTLTEQLRDLVLQKCAKKQRKTLKELTEMKTGLKRNYCDDISIIALSFKQTNK